MSNEELTSSQFSKLLHQLETSPNEVKTLHSLKSVLSTFKLTDAQASTLETTFKDKYAVAKTPQEKRNIALLILTFVQKKKSISEDFLNILLEHIDSPDVFNYLEEYFQSEDFSPSESIFKKLLNLSKGQIEHWQEWGINTPLESSQFPLRTSIFERLMVQSKGHERIWHEWMSNSPLKSSIRGLILLLQVILKDNTLIDINVLNEFLRGMSNDINTQSNSLFYRSAQFAIIAFFSEAIEYLDEDNSENRFPFKELIGLDDSAFLESIASFFTDDLDKLINKDIALEAFHTLTKFVGLVIELKDRKILTEVPALKETLNKIDIDKLAEKINKDQIENLKHKDTRLEAFRLAAANLVFAEEIKEIDEVLSSYFDAASTEDFMLMDPYELAILYTLLEQHKNLGRDFQNRATTTNEQWVSRCSQYIDQKLKHAINNPQALIVVLDQIATLTFSYTLGNPRNQDSHFNELFNDLGLLGSIRNQLARIALQDAKKSDTEIHKLIIKIFLGEPVLTNAEAVEKYPRMLLMLLQQRLSSHSENDTPITDAIVFKTVAEVKTAINTFKNVLQTDSKTALAGLEEVSSRCAKDDENSAVVKKAISSLDKNTVMSIKTKLLAIIQKSNDFKLSEMATNILVRFAAQNAPLHESLSKLIRHENRQPLALLPLVVGLKQTTKPPQPHHNTGFFASLRSIPTAKDMTSTNPFSSLSR